MAGIHTIKNPFPMKLEVGTVIDERCYCGHMRSEHADTAQYGHGGCRHLEPECSCTKFTWKAFILKTSTRGQKLTPFRK